MTAAKQLNFCIVRVVVSLQTAVVENQHLALQHANASVSGYYCSLMRMQTAVERAAVVRPRVRHTTCLRPFVTRVRGYHATGLSDVYYMAFLEL